MSQDNDSVTGGFELRNFERNRYFQGKLMSARDMVTDQQYHADRLEALTKLVDGTGIVAGLGISDFEERDDELQVTVDPGLAVDANGRPVVLRNPTTRTVLAPEGDELHLYIEYDTETKDPVPVPGNEPLSEEESEESRILEVSTLSARETAPSTHDTIPQVDIPDFETTDATVDEIARELANRYHDAERRTIDSPTDPAVFLGTFKRDSDGRWRVARETARRPLVYDNDMLFSLLVSHISDTDNPHYTRVGEPTEYMESELDRMDDLALRLQRLQSELTTLSEKLELHVDYTARRSLKTTARFLDDLADSFEEHGEISRLSLEVVESIREGFGEQVGADRDEYVAFVRVLLDDLRTLSGALSGQVTERSHDQFDGAVEALSAALDGDPTVVEVATALDTVAESADLLEKQTKVVPDSD